MKESWKRLKGESSKIYSYFCFYRDLGIIRSLEKVSEKFVKSLQIMQRYSSKYDWVKRSEAWDDYQNEIKQKEQEEEIKKMSKRHADIALGMQTKAIQKLRDLNVDELKPADIVRFIGEGVRIERLSRGVPDRITKELVEPNEDEIIVRWREKNEVCTMDDLKQTYDRIMERKKKTNDTVQSGDSQ